MYINRSMSSGNQTTYFIQVVYLSVQFPVHAWPQCYFPSVTVDLERT